MTKMLAEGHIEQEFDPDYCDVILTVNTEGKNAAIAASSSMTEFERLISCLSDLGYKPENMIIIRDQSRRSRRENEDEYSSEKAVRLRIRADVAQVNAIHDLIASGFKSTTIRVDYWISSYDEIMRDLTKQAIQDSRDKAELLAEATGTKVIGIEAARFDGNDDVDMNIADLDLSIIDDVEKERGLYRRETDCSFADRLRPDKIKMIANVQIVWRLE